MSFSSILFLSKNGFLSFTVPKSVADGCISENNLRVLCIINDEARLHCALKRAVDGNYYISLSAKTCKHLSFIEGSIINYNIQKDESTYQFEMPEEMSQALALDIEASEVFHALTKGNQRSLIYLVQQSKTIEKRIEKSLLIMERLKQGITSPREVLKK